jgi:hypothetical protein
VRPRSRDCDGFGGSIPPPRATHALSSRTLPLDTSDLAVVALDDSEEFVLLALPEPTQCQNAQQNNP